VKFYADACNNRMLSLQTEKICWVLSLTNGCTCTPSGYVYAKNISEMTGCCVFIGE